MSQPGSGVPLGFPGPKETSKVQAAKQPPTKPDTPTAENSVDAPEDHSLDFLSASGVLLAEQNKRPSYLESYGPEALLGLGLVVLMMLAAKQLHSWQLIEVSSLVVIASLLLVQPFLPDSWSFLRPTDKDHPKEG